MYLHKIAEPEASFTKEDMHAGKHTEYERKLHEQLAARTQDSNCVRTL
jgi:CCR4-NOT transcription complex subunit 4